MENRIIIVFAAIFFLFNSKNLLSNDRFEQSGYFSVNFGYGYAFYDFDNMKNILSNSVNNLNFPAKITDNYPNIPSPNLEIAIDMPEISFGLFYNYISTGARISYADYSGSFTSDHKISCSSFGIILTKFAKRYDNYDIGIFLKTALNKIKYEYVETKELYTIKESNIYKEDYNAYFFEFGGRFFYYYSQFKIGFEAGYGFEINNNSVISFDGPRLLMLAGLSLNIID